MAISSMVDPGLQRLQQEMRSSPYPVSAFYLIDTPASVNRLDQLLHQAFDALGMDLLAHTSVREVVEDAVANESPAVNFRRDLSWELSVDAKPEKVWAVIRNVPNHGFEFELILAGSLLTRTAVLTDNEFWSEFMPPAFYAR